jgi:hypothetical protein
MTITPLLETSTVPEQLPGEPHHPRLSALPFTARLVSRGLGVGLLLGLTLGLWPLYGLGVLVWGRPPNVPRLPQVARYLRLIVTVRPPPPGLSVLVRSRLVLAVLRKVAVTPVWGLAWLLDELLYGRALDRTPIVAPLIEISAARSGSTQLARYLEQDPRLAAPSFLQSVFPYLWLWRIAPRTLGRFIDREAVRRKLESSVPPEFLERHEGDPFLTDTFDIALYIAHLNHLAPLLGPDTLADDFGFAGPAPHNRHLWEHDFVRLLERIGRKTLLHAGPAPDGGPRRFFVKGHFLSAAEALSRRFPDARFLTMIREPAPRLQSSINFLRSNVMDPTIGQVPWAWLAEALVRSEIAYCEQEQEWFTRSDGARRCVLRFSEYVRDLEGAMRKVYRECLDSEALPPHVPRQHPARKRSQYRVDRSLSQVGVSEAELDARLAPYIAWCRQGS